MEGIPASPRHPNTRLNDYPCDLSVYDADSDVLFPNEEEPINYEEYQTLKYLVLKSAGDFLSLYNSIPDKNISHRPQRKTFYGSVPRTAEEMYQHTKNVNAYYFREIGIAADNDGSIVQCRYEGFQALEKTQDFLSNKIFAGSYGEFWRLRKILRRFLWHDRIHAKAMYRMAVAIYGKDAVTDVFCFGHHLT